MTYKCDHQHKTKCTVNFFNINYYFRLTYNVYITYFISVHAGIPAFIRPTKHERRWMKRDEALYLIYEVNPKYVGKKAILTCGYSSNCSPSSMGKYWICKKNFATGKIQTNSLYVSHITCHAYKMTLFVTWSYGWVPMAGRIRCDLTPHSLSKETDVQILGE